MFKGRKIWITGAETPAGQALARAFYKAGALLILSGVEHAPEGVEAECHAQSPTSDSIAQKTLEHCGGLDILVHACREIITTSIEQCTVDQWEQAMRENVSSAWCACHAAVRAMGKRRKGACILIISSIHAEKPTGSSFLYSVSQGALSMMVSEAAQDYGRLGIRVNMLLAGAIEGDDKLFPSEFSTIYDEFEAKVPRQCAGTLKEVIKPAMFLCSNKASFINGASLQVDGGFTGYYIDADSEKRWDYGQP